MLLPCSCGKMLRFHERYLGRTVQCPTCGRSQVVQSLPTTGAAALLSTATRVSWSKRHSWKGLALQLLAILVGAVVLTMLVLLLRQWSQTEEFDPSDYIPEDSIVVLHLRPGELWQNTTFRRAFDRPGGAVDRLRRWFHLTPEEVLELILVGNRPDQAQDWALLRLNKSSRLLDLSKHWQASEIRPHGRLQLRIGWVDENKRLALTQLSQQWFLVAGPENLKEALRLRRRLGTRPTASVAELLPDEQALLILQPDEPMRRQLRSMLGLAGVALLADLPVLKLRGSLTDQLKLTFSTPLPPHEPQRGQVRDSLRRVRAFASAVALIQSDPFFEVLGQSDLQPQSGEMCLQWQGDPAAVLARLAERLGQAGW
ncbi:MAG: hypothetical protein SNJ82_09805 [Gemmataceae bacterium]